MNLKKIARERWKDPVFQKGIGPLLSALTKGAVALVDVDMAGITIGKTGPLKELWNINLYQAKLVNADMSYADIACSLNEIALQRVILIDADLDRCLIRKAKIIECDFSASKLIVSLDDSIFEMCKFKGAAFLSGRAGAEYGGRRVKFIGCDFSGAIFKGVEFRASQFVDCLFDGAKFIECDFRGVKAKGGVLPVASQFEKMEAPTWAISAS